MNPKLTGAYGEYIAARFLRDNGYDILTSNYRIINGEVDIIADKNNIIHFVEVKTRKAGGMYSPADAVDKIKQDKILVAAGAYLNRFGMHNDFQFDIIEVITDEGDNSKVVSVNLIEKAF